MKGLLCFTGAIALVTCGALFERSGRLIQPQLQPKVAIVSSRGTASEFSEICPRIAVIESYNGDDETKPDYGTFLGWANDRWASWTKRVDGAMITTDLVDADYKAIFRKTCEAITQDAARWASDQKFRSQASITGEHTTSTLSKASDPPGRYELTESRDGVVLLDTELGRAWVLNERHTQFDEIGVKKLWDDYGPMEEYSRNNPQLLKSYLIQEQRLDYIRDLTRPRSMQEADYKIISGNQISPLNL